MRWKTGRLSSPARGLLLAIIQAQAEGIDRMTAGEWKEEAGIGNHRDWGTAIRQLEEAGLATLTKRGHMFAITNLTVSTASVRETDRWIEREINDKIDNLSIYRNTDAKAAEHDAGEQFLADLGLDFSSNGLNPENSSNGLNLPVGSPDFSSNGLNPEKYRPNEPKPNIGQMNYISENSSDGLKSQEYRPDELKTKCILVDQMDDSGDLSRANSPAQARRRAQVPVVQKAWSNFFPDSPALLADNARGFLRDLGNSAEEVYDFFERIAQFKPRNPLTYARRVLESERKSAPVSSAPQPAFVPGPEPAFDPVEAERIDRAAHAQRVKLWRRWHPNEPIPENL